MTTGAVLSVSSGPPSPRQIGLFCFTGTASEGVPPERRLYPPETPKDWTIIMEYQHGVTDAQQTSSNLAPSGRMGFTGVVGGGSLEVTSGHGMTQTTGVEHHTAPSADPVTAYTFSTEAGLPVPGGTPRPNDMVEIAGMHVKVAQAVRDGLIPDPFRMAPQQALNAAQSTTEGQPQGNP